MPHDENLMLLACGIRKPFPTEITFPEGLCEKVLVQVRPSEPWRALRLDAATARIVVPDEATPV